MANGNDSNTTILNNITSGNYNTLNKMNLSGTSAAQTPPLMKTTDMDFGNNLNGKTQKRTRQKPELSPTKMNYQQQNSKSGQPATANSCINNQAPFTKSMGDWLHSSANSNNNNNNNNINNQNSNNNNNINNNNGNGSDINYQQKHLDDWLNASMKDSPKTFSISSTEFPDPSTTRNAQLNGMILMPPINGMRPLPEFQNFPNQSNFAYVNNFESSPYFQASNFPPSAAALKMPTLHSDFASLPPAVNLNVDTNRSSSQNDLLDGSDNRRFSDPCLAGNSEDETQQDGRDKINSKNQSDNNKLLATLIKQINILHETNSRICRNLNDTKIELETLKHAPNWDFRNRRDSISGFSTHSQPMGYTFGTHSPAPTYHSGMYTPGMMTDVVREVKEAARIREEALLSRVRALVEERSWTMNESNLKLMRDFEEMKIQINQLKCENQESRGYITKLEEQVKALRELVSHLVNSGPTNTSLILANHSTPINYTDNKSIRSEMSNQQMNQKRQGLGMHYATDDKNEKLRPMQKQSNDNECFQFNRYDQITNADNENHDITVVQMEKDNLELRRELQDTRASKKQADKIIQDLEQRLKALESKSISNASDNVVTISTGHSSSTRFNNGGTKADDYHGKPKFTSSAQTVSPKVLTASNGTSTISLTGPVTDL